MYNRSVFIHIVFTNYYFDKISIILSKNTRKYYKNDVILFHETKSLTEWIPHLIVNSIEFILLKTKYDTWLFITPSAKNKLLREIKNVLKRLYLILP